MIGLYPGAFNDEVFLHIPEFKDVKEWILVDMAPCIKYWPKGCLGYALSHDIPTFRNTLEKKFGPVVKFGKNLWVFKSYDTIIYYYYKTDITKFIPTKKIDLVYFCGADFKPHELKFKYDKLYVTCECYSIADPNMNPIEVHPTWTGLGEYQIGDICWCRWAEEYESSDYVSSSDSEEEHISDSD